MEAVMMRILSIWAVVLCVCLPLLGDTTTNVSILNGFNPVTVTINAGGSVTWTNNDTSDHDVTAADGSFHSGNLKAGQSYSHTFTAAGKFPYGCSLHPREQGLVIVKN
jgi:plastocyanin